MQKQYLIGIDVGTQSAKVVIFDAEGQVVCSASHALKAIVIPGPRLAEHVDEDIWDSLKLALQEVMREFRADPSRDVSAIAAAGLCGIRCCRVLLRADGSLASPVMSWMDERLNEPYRHLPQYGDVKYVTSTSGYLTLRLTGEHKDTCANYIGHWPIDGTQWSSDADFMAASGLTRDMLFDLVQPGEVLGSLRAEVAAATGLPEGLPVVATAHDKAVEALGAGLLEEGAALISLGTYICAMLNGGSTYKHAESFWPFQAAIPENYLYECMGVRRGMWTISWFCQQFRPGVEDLAKQAGLSVEDWFNAEAEQVPAGSEGLITIHDWAPPADHPYRKGVMFGFDGRHTRAHMYRSLLEGIAFTLKNHLDPMIDELGVSLDKIIVSGGGARSDVFLQIIADCFGVPVQRNQINDSAAIGAAICAGIGLGLFADHAGAVAKMVTRRDSKQPLAQNTALYNDLNTQVYQNAQEHFAPSLKSLAEISD